MAKKKSTSKKRVKRSAEEIARDKRNARRRELYAEKREAARVAQEKREAKNARRRAAYAEKTREKRERREERARREKRQYEIVGDVPTIVVSVFAVKGRHNIDMTATKIRVNAEVKRALGRGVVETPKTQWATNFDFRAPLTHVSLARKLAKLREVDLDGGRVHIGAVASDGTYLPLSYAFDSMTETSAMAVDEVLKHLLWYAPVEATRMERVDFGDDA